MKIEEAKHGELLPVNLLVFIFITLTAYANGTPTPPIPNSCTVDLEKLEENTSTVRTLEIPPNFRLIFILNKQLQDFHVDFILKRSDVSFLTEYYNDLTGEIQNFLAHEIEFAKTAQQNNIPENLVASRLQEDINALKAFTQSQGDLNHIRLLVEQRKNHP